MEDYIEKMAADSKRKRDCERNICKKYQRSKEIASPSKAFSSEDLELALDLLQLPCTPNCTTIFECAPNVDITPARVNFRKRPLSIR
jgi:hypothetical protein